MYWQNLLLVVIVVFAVLAAWLGRYEIIGVAPGGQGMHGVAYRLDRWNGSVVWMSVNTGGAVSIDK